MVARAVAAALIILAALPAAASAHAQLQSTIPERGQRLSAAPKEVVLDFNEPVEVAFGAVKVFDAKGTPVQSGAPFHRGDHADQVAVKLPASLPQGGYTLTYRVISADSHPVSGGFVFSYGSGAGPAATVDELLAGSGAGKVTSTALSAARAVQYAAVALGAGALIFFVLCWRRGLADASGGKPEAWPAAADAFRDRTRRLLLMAAAAGGLSAAAALVLQGANAGGTTFWSALDAQVVNDVIGTRFGTVWGIGLLAWIAMLAVVAVRPRQLPVLPAGVLAAGLCLAPALGGHASVQSPRALLLPANVLHVGAMAAWLGGIAMLVLALRSATRAVEPGDRVRLLTSVVARFSAMAGTAIAVILATGVAQSIVYVEAPAHLLDTAFGRAVLIKSVLFIAICGLGFLNRNRVLPRLRVQESAAAAGALLRRTLRFELALGVTVIAVTGALAGYPPSTAVSSGPFSGSAVIGPARVEVTVDPARTGANEMHLYLFDRRSGAQWDRADEVTVHAQLPGKGIEPIAMATQKAGPGHYVINGATFGVAGDWKVEIGARVGEFDLYTATLGVPIG